MMFGSRLYKPVSQEGDSDMDSDNETAFFSTENSSKKWRIGARSDHKDLALQLPYVHPTMPVETKKVNYKNRYARRQIISGVCLLFLIIGMISGFAVTIILGRKYMNDVLFSTTDTDGGNIQPSFMPVPTPSTNFIPSNGQQNIVNLSVANTLPAATPVPNNIFSSKSPQDINPGVTKSTDHGAMHPTPATNFEPNIESTRQESPQRSIDITMVSSDVPTMARNPQTELPRLGSGIANGDGVVTDHV